MSPFEVPSLTFSHFQSIDDVLFFPFHSLLYELAHRLSGLALRWRTRADRARRIGTHQRKKATESKGGRRGVLRGWKESMAGWVWSLPTRTYWRVNGNNYKIEMPTFDWWGCLILVSIQSSIFLHGPRELAQYGLTVIRSNSLLLLL